MRVCLRREDLSKSSTKPLILVIDRNESIHKMFLKQIENHLGEKAKGLVAFASEGVTACNLFQKNISSLKLVFLSGILYYKNYTLSWRIRTDETLGVVEFMAHYKRPCNNVPKDIRLVSISEVRPKEMLKIGCYSAIKKRSAARYALKYLKQKGLA